MFYFSSDDIELAGASPETLVKLEDKKLTTFPLAGTRPRGKTKQEDRELEEGLLKDEKELAEHNMLVDLGRNDIGRISKIGTVEVEKYMSVEHFSQVMHIGSTVAGELREDKDAIDAVDSILPAGTLSGAPKFRACQIIEELEQFRKEFAGARRTVIMNAEEAVFEEKKVEEAEVCFLMDRFGYAKTLDKNTYERNKETVHGEYKYVFTCMNTDKICLFTNKGQMHTVKVMDLPLTRLRDKGVPVDNLSNFLSAQEELLCVSSMEAVKNSHIIFVTKSGMIKQVPGTEFDVIKRTIASTKLAEDDELVLVDLCDTMDYVVLQSHDGYFLRFLKEEVPEKKKAALGVRAIKMSDKDYLEHGYLLESRMEYQIEYKEKQMILNKIKLGKRDTKGTKVRV